MTTIAQQVEGIRTVSGSTERDASFPAPATGQKVYNSTTRRIEQWSGTAWIPVLGTPVIDVTMFGAVGDGATNDAAAFTAAFVAAGNYGAVFVPPGTYKLSSTITLTRFQHLIGCGNASILQIDHTGDGVLFDGSAPVSPSADRPSIQNLRFKTTSWTPAALIANDFTQNLLISQVFMDAATFTIGIDNRRGYLLEINRITFQYCTGVAIRLRQSTADSPYWTYAPTIRGVDISHHTGDGIRMESAQGLIQGCVIESTTGDGIQLMKAALANQRGSVHIESCYFEEVTGFSIKSYLSTSGTLNALITNTQFIDGAVNTSRIYVDGSFTFDNCIGNPGNTFSGIGFVRLRHCYGMHAGTGAHAGLTIRILDKTVSTATSLVAHDFQKGINVNGGFGGGAALILCSHSVGSGDNTNAELFLIRYGYDGNNFAAISIKRSDGVTDNRTYTFTVDADGYLKVAANGTGNAKYMVVAQLSDIGENFF